MEPKLIDRNPRSPQSTVVQRDTGETGVEETLKQWETAEGGCQTLPLSERRILRELLDTEEILGEINSNRPDLLKEMFGLLVSKRF